MLFYKMTPFAIRFAAAGIKITILYFLPYSIDLLCYNFNILRRDYNFLFLIFFDSKRDTILSS